ncbi:AcrR family transcriptional regulator [Caulobacter ginsengisoli]|uniref:AcrR family transcriptional regulator n=1 Tax=Caulobacter ginsengisoli TaxID=400775 RepID=A0ABU0ITY1_9CAUL|nr:TetR family transcriptional regulator [Caulobacter ginsengisoli]MDQ0465460.1 AcrR family transcriptional regulator [Caulobacter ginsengisoli]
MAAGRRTQEERSGATRGAVMAAARRLFASQGFAETSIEEILGQAGVTRGALYHHFNGKAAIFLAVFETLEAELADRVTAAASGAADPWGGLMAGCQAFLEACLDPEIRRISLLDAPSVLGLDEVRRIEGLYTLARLRAGLRACATAGEIDSDGVDMLAHLLLGALAQAGTAIAQAKDAQSARAKAWTAARRLLEGLRLRPDRTR